MKPFIDLTLGLASMNINMETKVKGIIQLDILIELIPLLLVYKDEANNKKDLVKKIKGDLKKFITFIEDKIGRKITDSEELALITCIKDFHSTEAGTPERMKTIDDLQTLTFIED